MQSCYSECSLRSGCCGYGGYVRQTGALCALDVSVLMVGVIHAYCIERQQSVWNSTRKVVVVLL